MMKDIGETDRSEQPNSAQWNTLRNEPFVGEKNSVTQISDSEAVAQIYRNLNEARREALENGEDEEAERLDADMDVLNDAYNRMNEPENQGKMMVDMFNEMRVEYFQKIDETSDESEKNALFAKMTSASNLGSTYNALKKYVVGQLRDKVD